MISNTDFFFYIRSRFAHIYMDVHESNIGPKFIPDFNVIYKFGIV